MAISVQVDDVTHGCPASGVGVRLEQQLGHGWSPLDYTVTDDSGHIDGAWGPAASGLFRLAIETQKFFASLGLCSPHPEVTLTLRVTHPDDDYSVSVELAPFACVLRAVRPQS